MASQKVAVVTGSNKGIGYAIVKGLCEKFQGTVYLTARDIDRGKAAVSQLKELGLNPEFHQLDICNEESIKKLKDYLVEKHGGIDLLVNNAAIAFKHDATEPFSEQAKTTIAVNYFATLKACEILFPILRNNARVVNLSSSAGHLSRIPSADLRSKLNSPELTVPQLSALMEQFVRDTENNKHQEAGWGNSTYVVSKVAVSALTKVQQREFDKESTNRNISVNSVHPGYVDTDMTSHKGPWTIEQGAKGPLFLALEAENLKGQYIWSDATVAQWDSDKPPAVTGANKGIGYAIVQGLCQKFQGTVYLTARDSSRGQAAVSKLNQLGLKPLFHQLDVTDVNSINKLKDHLVEKHGGLDLLVNNAGILLYVLTSAKPTFGEVAETTIEVNYFSQLKVCEILFPILRTNAKVVHVSSSEGHLSKIRSLDLRAKLNDPNLTIPQLNNLMHQFVQDAKNNKHSQVGWCSHSAYGAYSVSKVGLSALTILQQREFDKETPNRNICVNSVHPGYCQTDLTGHSGPWTMEQGAHAPLFLALEAENLKGKYVWSNAKVTPWDSEQPPAAY